MHPSWKSSKRLPIQPLFAIFPTAKTASQTSRLSAIPALPISPDSEDGPHPTLSCWPCSKQTITTAQFPEVASVAPVLAAQTRCGRLDFLSHRPPHLQLQLPSQTAS